MNLFLFLLVGIFGGTTGSLIKYVGQEVPPILLTSIRFGVSALLLLPLIFFYKEKFPKKQWKLLFFSGIALATNVMLFATGVQHTSAIMSQIIYTPTSILVAIFGYLFLGEKLSKNQMIGLAITIFGMLILILGSIENGDIHSFGKPFGNFLIIIALFCWTAYLVISRKAIQDISPLASTFYNFLVAFVITLIVMPIESASSTKSIQVTVPLIIASVLLVTTSTFFIFLYQRFLKTTSAFSASLVTYINPIAAAFVGISVFGERLTPQLLIGALIVFVGVFMATSYDFVRGKIKKTKWIFL